MEETGALQKGGSKTGRKGRQEGFLREKRLIIPD